MKDNLTAIAKPMTSDLSTKTHPLEQGIRRALANPLRDDRSVDPLKELAGVLAEVGLDTKSAGGKVEFIGRDPIVNSPLAMATMSAVGLMAKAVSVGDFWRFRGGEAQDLSVDLGQALHRLCPFYDKKWELLNGYAPGMPSDPTSPFMPANMYLTKDGRRMHLMNFYPRLKTSALAFLGCNDDPRAIGEVVRRWNGFELEEAMNRAGLQASVLRSVEEFLAEEQCRYVEDMPLIEIEKVGESDPEPLPPTPTAPLSGVRALGLGHVIAAPGFGRAFAYHGADVLNVWRPNDVEIDFIYYTANVGMRSTTLEIGEREGLSRFKDLLKNTDVVFANRRPAYLNKLGLSTDEMARIRPGIVQVDISVYGPRGPWANRIGFDHVAGGVTGILALEGSLESPKLPEIFVVNDFVTSWLSTVGAIAALKRRATEGGSYRVRISIARMSLWLLKMGIFDKAYAASIAGTPGDHVYRDPETFQADTPCGHYLGVTDQVGMSRTPGFYSTPLVARGASKAEWLAR
jgi:hypothetical protein